jgi:hypothetical protein
LDDDIDVPVFPSASSSFSVLGQADEAVVSGASNICGGGKMLVDAMDCDFLAGQTITTFLRLAAITKQVFNFRYCNNMLGCSQSNLKRLNWKMQDLPDIAPYKNKNMSVYVPLLITHPVRCPLKGEIPKILQAAAYLWGSP